MPVALNAQRISNANQLNEVVFKGRPPKFQKNIQTDKFEQSLLAKSLIYIKNRKAELERAGEKLEAVSQLDTNMLSGILTGLPTFKCFDSKNLGLLNNILIIDTQRG